VSNERRIGLVTVTVLFMVVAATSTADDKIEVTNLALSEDLGYAVDGIKGSETVNDEARVLSAVTTDKATVTVGPFDRGTDGDLVAFQKHRMVGITPALWTTGDETLTIDMKEEQGIGLVVWYLVERNSSQFNRAMQGAALAAQVWCDERMGLKLASVVEKDKSTDRAAKSLLRIQYESKPTGKSDCDRLVEEYPPEPNMVNVYYVEEVDFGSGYATTNGVWCGDSGNNVVILGKDARCDLMGHEFGHALLLNHVSGADFDDRNMMWAISTKRRLFTEGQLFMAHVVDGSAINKTYGLRSGGTMHGCTTETNCPDVDLRVWPE